MSDAPSGEQLPSAEVRKRTGIQAIWVIPIIAALIAAFLAWNAIENRGPVITLTLRTADGLQAGQTKVRHKAVDLGTVKHIVLSDDMTRVTVTIEMQRHASRYLTSNARFWVVRPRIGFGGVSGLDTLLSGSYIELDPGSLDGAPQTEFIGLEEPPALRSDEPGRTFVLTTPRIGAISSGSPLFYRDLTVGEVLSYELDPRGKIFTIHVFVRKPYYSFVHNSSQFWNASGISLDLGPRGIQLEVESLQALIGGGVAFDNFDDERPSPEAPEGHSFLLQPSAASATTASQSRRIPMKAHFDASVRGLAVDAPVEMNGIQIGTVTDVRLRYDPKMSPPFYADVRIDVEMGRIMREQQIPQSEIAALMRELVAKGLRAELQSANLVTGQMFIALEFDPDAKPGELAMEDGMFLLPSVSGGISNITANLGQITKTLAALPLQQIADNLNETLKGTNAFANSGELRKALVALSEVMTNAQDLVRKVDNGVTPALKRLPEIAQGLQSTVERANKLLGSADNGYGTNSPFKRDLDRLLSQISDTARSIRILADYLEQHPSALVRGRE